MQKRSTIIYTFVFCIVNIFVLCAIIPEANSKAVAIRAKGEISKADANLWVTLIAAGSLILSVDALFASVIAAITCVPNPLNPVCVIGMTGVIMAGCIGALITSAGLLGDFLIGDLTTTEVNSKIEEAIKALSQSARQWNKTNIGCASCSDSVIQCFGLEDINDFDFENEATTSSSGSQFVDNDEFHFRKYGFIWELKHDKDLNKIKVNIHHSESILKLV